MSSRHQLPIMLLSRSLIVLQTLKDQRIDFWGEMKKNL